MKPVQVTILVACAGLMIGCADSKFSTKAKGAISRDVSSTSTPAPDAGPTQAIDTGSFTDTNSVNGTGANSGGYSSDSGASSGSTGNVCNGKFEVGFLCQRGNGIALADDDKAEGLCRNYCDAQKAACCALGRTNIAAGSGKVFCHASIYARTKYVNNFAQLYPESVDKGRTTSISALNCSTAQALTFTWGNAPTACLQGYDFKQYGQVPSNLDVLNATGGDAAQLQAHWYNFGNREGRDLYLASPGLRSQFNAASYLANQPDVLLAGVHPWSHYQSCGIFERRSIK